MGIMGSKGIFTYAGIGHEKVNLPPQKINMPPESQWLEDVFSYWNSLFLGGLSFIFGGCNPFPYHPCTVYLPAFACFLVVNYGKCR